MPVSSVHEGMHGVQCTGLIGLGRPTWLRWAKAVSCLRNRLDGANVRAILRLGTIGK
jgi:hypothetical protein